ncbi:hypothetical protein [Marinoscillum sp.]|uniref:hypothetical protein n=1 Tax=Marinoscillum sp. TaxID=2024838 RepID=UPI003BABBF92
MTENKKIKIKPYVIYLFVGMFVMFALNKLLLRPFVLQNDLANALQVMVLSFPNFAEAVMGTMVLTGILFRVKHITLQKVTFLQPGHVFLAAAILAAIYVIFGELRVHNLGNNNTYDPNDLIASVIGLNLAYFTVRKFGFATIHESAKN